MSDYPIVVIGASAGGVAPLQELVSGFPTGLQAAIFVVLHIWPESESLLPHILSRAGPLPAVHALDGEPIEPGKIFVAPPDYHLLVKQGVMRLDHGPAENRHRPAIDPLFRSAASAYDSGVVGVLLSGSDDDGSVGLRFIQAAGGTTIVQDPRHSVFSRMPEAAIGNGAADHILKVPEIASCIQAIAQQPARTGKSPKVPEHEDDTPAPVYCCPDCGGGMHEVETGGVLRFRCRVGHVLSPESMIAGEGRQVESALWAAVRSLEDQAAVFERLLDRSLAGNNGSQLMQSRYRERVVENQQHARIIRDILQQFPNNRRAVGSSKD